MKNVKALKRFLIENLPIKEVIQEMFPKWKPDKNVVCEFHDDKDPSLSIAYKKGKKEKQYPGRAYCHSCGFKANSIVGLYEEFYEVTFRTALAQLYRDFIRPTVSTNTVKKAHEALLAKLEDPIIETALCEERGITLDTVKRWKLGWHNQRLTIPVYNKFGLCINVRKYDLLKIAKKGFKFVNWKVGYGEPVLWPQESLKSKEIIICEGEMDCLVLLQLGFPAITSTSGGRNWDPAWSPLFKKKSVIIIHDVNDKNDAGQVAARLKIEALRRFVKQIKNVPLPLKEKGGDVTDYVVKWDHTKKDLRTLIAKTKWEEAEEPDEDASVEDLDAVIIGPPESFSPDVHNLPFRKAISNDNYGGMLSFEAKIQGRARNTFISPQVIEVVCEGKKKMCEGCHMNYHDNCRRMVFKPESHELLKSIETNHLQQKGLVRTLMEIPKVCHFTYQIEETQGIQKVQLTAPMHLNGEGSIQWVDTSIPGYYLGEDLEDNRLYQFEGFSMPHPRNQTSVLMLKSAKPLVDDLDDFELTENEIEELRDTFNPEDKDIEAVEEKFEHLYRSLASNVTKIYGRADLHQAVDLVWHSPLSFKFNEEYIRKGYLDVLVIGDPRTGKGYVTEGLARHYGIGQVVAGENCSLAGLVGGLQQVAGEWMVSWGVWPLNDRRLVIMDEMMRPSDMAQTSRARSEGVCQLSKVGHNQITMARTRLIWLSNPKDGRPLSYYSTGVEAIRELVPAHEDIARFDYALALSSNEIDPATIHSPHEVKKNSYTSELCRKLILWIWSRGTHQIRFTKRAVKMVITNAIKLGRRYSSSIPLVQIENMRIKLAKVSAAIAGRLFSCSRGGNILVVRPVHVRAAAAFFRLLYDKPAMGYDVYSYNKRMATGLTDVKGLNKFIDSLGPYTGFFVEGLQQLDKIRSVDILHLVNGDREIADRYLGTLVRHGAVSRKGRDTYTKKGAFSRFLKDKLGELQLGKSSPAKHPERYWE